MELWARKRKIEGYGQRFEFITYLDEQHIYSESDKLDRAIFEECMVVNEGRCVFFREFDMPFVKKRGAK